MRDRIAAELLDVLVLEGLATVVRERHDRARVRLADGLLLTAGGHRDVTGRWRTTTPVRAEGRACHPAELVHGQPGGRDVAEALACAACHRAWAEGHRQAVVARARTRRSRTAWEALASLRGRPGHPAAHARVGWSVDDLDRYAPEGGATFRLRWVAVARDRIRSGPMAEDPSALLCTPGERQKLDAALEAAGGKASTHLLLPVHPAHVGAVGASVPLLPAAVDVTPTASLRTVRPCERPGVAVKLPLAMRTLAAQRLLPPRYCANAVVGQELLGHAFARTATPVPVHLADERRWWAIDEGGGLTEDPGTLGCVVRTEPQLEELVPLGALAERAALEIVCGDDLRRQLALLTEVATAVTGVALAAAAAGLAPELHGQNVLLHLEDAGVAGVVLRDHDAVRSYPPWLRATGLPQPVLAVSADSPNTLVNTSPEALLAWFQTLAVDVALRGVAEALARGDPDQERAAWRAITTGVRHATDTVAMPEPVAAAVAGVLDSSHWPHKHMLRPWLARRGRAGASMPSAFGCQPNPLRVGDVAGART